MIFDLSGKQLGQKEFTDLPQYENEPEPPEDAHRGNIVISLAVCTEQEEQNWTNASSQNWAIANSTQSKRSRPSQNWAIAGSMQHPASTISHETRSRASLVQDRVMQFQMQRAAEKARTLNNIAGTSGASIVLGIFFYICSTVWNVLDGNVIVYYFLRSIGVALLALAVLLFSTCLKMNVFSILDLRPYLRMSVGLALILTSSLYAKDAPHFGLVGTIPASMLLFGAAYSEKKPCFPYSTSLLSATMLSLNLTMAAAFWNCYFLATSDNLSDYCSGWTKSDIALLLQACWTTAGFMCSATYYAWRWGWLLASDDRAMITGRILHSLFIIQGGFWIIGGVANLVSDAKNYGSGKICIGVAWCIPVAIISGVGSNNFFRIATRVFENRRVNKDSAFMAMLLDDVGIVVGQNWWVRKNDNSEWHCGVVVQVTENEFMVSATELAKPTARRGSLDSTLSSSFRNSQKSSGRSQLTSTSIHYTLPLGGRQLSALELHSLAQTNLRCIDWREMSFELLNESSCCGKVEGDFSKSRPVRANERIDFFLSHSWHDDPVQKWSRLQHVAETFLREYKRYPTFWLDKACIDQSSIADGLKVLPIYVMTCKKVLALVGTTYPNRLWCVWELFTVFAFADEEHALGKVQLVPAGSCSEDEMFQALLAFDSRQAHCFDPNEEIRLQRIINTVGKAHFESCIHRLSTMCLEAEQNRKHLSPSKTGGSSPTRKSEASMIGSVQS